MKLNALDNFVAQQRQTSLRTKMVAGMVGFSVVTSLVVAGCGGGGTSNAQPGTNGRSQYFSPFTAKTDLQYIDGITPHHMHTLEMAEAEIANGSSAPVKALAQQFITQQEKEIATLKAARKAITGSDVVPEPPADAHDMADLSRLKAARGAAADKEFLDNMIPHHAEGISIAHRAYPILTRADMITNSDEVFNTQSTEIGQMIALRGTTTQTGRR